VDGSGCEHRCSQVDIVRMEPEELMSSTQQLGMHHAMVMVVKVKHGRAVLIHQTRHKYKEFRCQAYLTLVSLVAKLERNLDFVL